VVEEAAGLLLARELSRRGLSVAVFDPSANGSIQSTLGQKARVAPTAVECIEQASVVVLATPWPEFTKIDAHKWMRPSFPRVVIDCWGVLGHLENAKGVHYKRLGKSGDMEFAQAAS